MTHPPKMITRYSHGPDALPVRFTKRPQSDFKKNNSLNLNFVISPPVISEDQLSLAKRNRDIAKPTRSADERIIEALFSPTTVGHTVPRPSALITFFRRVTIYPMTRRCVNNSSRRHAETYSSLTVPSTTVRAFYTGISLTFFFRTAIARTRRRFSPP